MAWQVSPEDAARAQSIFDSMYGGPAPAPTKVAALPSVAPDVAWEDPDAPRREDLIDSDIDPTTGVPLHAPAVELPNVEAEAAPATAVPARPTATAPAQPPQQQGGITRADLFARDAFSRANPNYESTKTWLEQTEKAQAYYDSAQRASIEQNNLHAEQMATEAAAQRAQGEAALLQAQKAEQVRAQQMDEEMETTQSYVAEMRKAAQELSSAAEIDPMRGWTNRTAGSKFLAGIGMLLGSAPGSTPGVNPGFEAVKDSIRMDIDAQKANFDQKATAFQARGDVVSGQQGFLASLRAKLGDDRAAELSLEGARLEQAKRTIDSLLAKGASATAKANGEIWKGQLDQAAADVQMQLAQRAKANPKRFVSSGYRYRGPVADAHRKVELQKIGAEGKAYEAGAIAGAKAEAELPYTVAAKQAEELAKQGPPGKVDDKTRAQAISMLVGSEDARKSLGTVNWFDRQITDMIASGDIAGIGREFGTNPFKFGDVVDTEQLKLLAQEVVARLQTGAAISENEEKRFTTMLQDGVVTGGEERFIRNFVKVRNMLWQSRVQPAFDMAQTIDPELASVLSAGPNANPHIGKQRTFNPKPRGEESREPKAMRMGDVSVPAEE